MERSSVLICGFSQEEYAGLAAALADAEIDAVHVCGTDNALALINQGTADLLFLDSAFAENARSQLFGLPREAFCPIIVFGRKNSEKYELGCFEAGAEDYIPLPCSPRIAAARACALLRRCGKTAATERIILGELVLFPELFRAFAKGGDLSLSPGDFRLLCFMSRNAGKVLTREQIQNEIWGYDNCSSPRAVDTQIKRLRRALENRDTGCSLCSVYGVGYKLVTNVRLF